MTYRRMLIIPLLALCIAAAPLAASASLLTVVEPDRKGSITIQSLAAENAGDDQEPGSGEAWENPSGLEPLANITYRVTQVEDEATDPKTAQPLEEDVYREEVTNQDGIAKFPGLDQGVYLVQQQANPAVEVRSEDFLVSIPMTNVAGTGWIYDVYVYPKYQLIGVPTLELYVEEEGEKYDSVNQGETVGWLLAAQVPADIAQAQNYQARVVFDASLAYLEGGESVYALYGESRTALVPQEDYDAQAQGNALTLTLTTTGKNKLDGLLTQGGEASLYARLETKLSIPAQEMATVLGSQIKADASLLYTSAVGKEHTVTPTGAAPYVYTGGLSVIQLQNATGAALEGAAFQVYPTLRDANANENAITAPESDEPWTVTTDGNGVALFEGLAYGGKGIPNDRGESDYYLVQTRAPAGYNLLHAPQPVTVNAASHLEENQVKIRARSGFLLPATGGIGTFWFTFTGLALIGLAIYFYLRARRKSRNRPRTGR